MRALDEHIKLARASIDFYPDLDSAFEINVAKVRAVLPTELRERLREPVEMLVRTAQSTYREHSSPSGGSRSARRNRPNGKQAASSRLALETAAKKIGELRALRRVLSELKKSDPDAARWLGW
jgi:hypothetical protein